MLTIRTSVGICAALLLGAATQFTTKNIKSDVAPVDISVGGANALGSSTALAPATHVHKCPIADGGVGGCVSAADYSTFNGKARVVSGTQALTPAAIVANSCFSYTAVTIDGVLDGEPCVVGYPIGSPNGLVYSCISESIFGPPSQVQIIICNVTTGPLTPPSTTYKFSVIK